MKLSMFETQSNNRFVPRLPRGLQQSLQAFIQRHCNLAVLLFVTSVATVQNSYPSLFFLVTKASRKHWISTKFSPKRAIYLHSLLFACTISSQLSKLLFITFYISYFGRTRARLVKSQIYPLVYQFLCKFQPNDTLAEAEDLGIVAEDSALDGERIMSGDGPDAGDFVG